MRSAADRTNAVLAYNVEPSVSATTMSEQSEAVPNTDEIQALGDMKDENGEVRKKAREQDLELKWLEM